MASGINTEDLEKGKRYAAQAAIDDRQFKVRKLTNIYDC